MVRKGLDYLTGFVRDDGGIYAEGSRIKNYETCVVLMAFAEANDDHRYDKIIKGADAYIRGLQAEGLKGGPASVGYGGVGYGGSTRPDLSNTAFLIDALKAAGAGPDDKAIQDALIFVSRCQNLESEHNTTEFAAKDPDGGFYYTPMAGKGPDAGKNGQGRAAQLWLHDLFGTEEHDLRRRRPGRRAREGGRRLGARSITTWRANPGKGTAGLFYYYITFAKALDALGNANSKRPTANRMLGTTICCPMAGQQEKDGSWVNANNQWLEGDANLTTGFALLALSYCRPQK